MSDLVVKGIMTQEGVAKYDYEALANKPENPVPESRKVAGMTLEDDIEAIDLLAIILSLCNDNPLAAALLASALEKVADDAMSSGSKNAVQNKVVKAYVDQIASAIGQAVSALDRNKVPTTRTIAGRSLDSDISQDTLGSLVTQAFAAGGSWYSTLIPWMINYCGSKTQQDANTESISNIQTTYATKTYVDNAEAEAKDYTDEQVKKTYPLAAAEGSIISITDGADNVPIKDLTVGIEPKQAGSGTPSPTNIRPLSGWESVKIFNGGYNLYNKLTNTDSYYLDDNGNEVSNPSWVITDFIPTSSAMSYTGIKNAGNAPYSCYYDENKTFISSFKQTTGINEIVPPSNAKWVKFSIIKVAPYSDNLSFEIYGGNLNEINLGRTVYGGSLDVTTGLLTVDRAIVDMGALTWVKQAQNHRFYTDSLASVLEKQPVDISDNLLCSMYKNIIWNDSEDLFTSMYTASDYRRIYVKDTNQDATSAEDFQTYVTGQTIVYPLAEPQTYQLTPIQIATLLGNNTIYADCGDSTLDYYADITDTLNNLPKTNNAKGIKINTDNEYEINPATTGEIKSAVSTTKPIVANSVGVATFYGLAKASGDRTQSASANPVGTYTDTAKEKIQQMIGILSVEEVGF
ncbi:MAG: hypothetical protein E7254_02650 [Lachnospiraceae bacterium]|nr:hypothetical protein [Lachnospiraceae bacterium]